MSKAKKTALEDAVRRRVFFLVNTNTILPDAVVRYLDASNRFDAASAAACFTPDAVVHDEGQQHVGPEAIRSWVSQTGQKYRPNTTVIRAQEKDAKIAVAVRVTGQFPGSPVELEFEFSLRDGKISELSIQ